MPQAVIIRLLDIVLSLIVLVLLAPVFIILCILVFRDLGRSIFFLQDRLGHHGEMIKIIKFRSMRNVELDPADHETVNEYAIKLKNDPRITRLGAFLRKTSLDELPQLINVLTGKMSLVGPRPWVAQEYQNFPKEWFVRLEAKPGITGLAQINGRSDLSMEEAIRLDKIWVDGYSVVLYIKILFKTFFAIIGGKNTY